MRANARWLAALVAIGSHGILASCNGSNTPLANGPETTGRVVEVTDPTLPTGHPEVPIGEPASMSGHVGRAPRRLNVDQLRSSLLAATGFTWVARRSVSDPDAPTGARNVPEADMLEAMARTLGRPDYVSSTLESIDPAVTFAKLSSDAARSACRQSVAADGNIPDADARRMMDRRIMRFAGLSDTAAANADRVRQNLSYLALRFWGRTIAAGDVELQPLFRLFERASTSTAGRDMNGTMRAAATVSDGWRAVCIALATDSQFLTY